jgi:hypothetical protein
MAILNNIFYAIRLGIAVSCDGRLFFGIIAHAVSSKAFTSFNKLGA